MTSTTHCSSDWVGRAGALRLLVPNGFPDGEAAGLRDDLAALGFERDDDVHEPEDHIAALCEVMAYLIADGASAETQRQFFEAHLGNWSPAFFDDLEAAEHASTNRWHASENRSSRSNQLT